ncbi:ImmA/IrrE family metallo-endopeptidase [Paenibacillus larvae]
MEKQLVQKLMKTHGTNDPWKITTERKIVVLFEDLGKNVLGYYTCINRIPCIHINNQSEDFLIAFSVAHELGHHLMHPGVNTPFLKKNTLFSIDKIEREANRFALHLLVGCDSPEYGETKHHFLLRCGIPEKFHIFY